MIYESVNLKEVMYSPKKTISAFILSPFLKVLQTLVLSFIKLIHWALNKFFLNWINRKLVQNSVNRFYYCIVEKLLFSKDFYQQFDWQHSTTDFKITRLCKACGGLVMQMLQFSGETRFQIFTQKWLLKTLNISSVPNWNHLIKVKWFYTQHYSIQTLTTYQ